MDTDVYCLCPKCKGITTGKGSGDITDFIVCDRCGEKFKARLVGNLSFALDEDKDKKWLYIEYDNANVFI